jgi:hypothetical protein
LNFGFLGRKLSYDSHLLIETTGKERKGKEDNFWKPCET